MNNSKCKEVLEGLKEFAIENCQDYHEQYICESCEKEIKALSHAIQAIDELEYLWRNHGHQGMDGEYNATERMKDKFNEMIKRLED